MANTKPGPDPKGTRKQHTVRVPEAQYEIYKQLAEESGLSLGDYIVLHMAIAHGQEIPAWISSRTRSPHGQQEELQLGA